MSQKWQQKTLWLRQSPMMNALPKSYFYICTPAYPNQWNINFLHLTDSKILKGLGHYSKVKGQVKVTLWSHQCLWQASTSYTLWFLRYTPDQIFTLEVIIARSKVKSRWHPQPLSLLSIIFHSLQFVRHSLDKNFKLKFTTARPKGKSRSHHNVAHPHPQTMCFPSVKFLYLMVSEIQPRQDYCSATDFAAQLKTMGENNTHSLLKAVALSSFVSSWVKPTMKICWIFMYNVWVLGCGTPTNFMPAAADADRWWRGWLYKQDFFCAWNIIWIFWKKRKKKDSFPKCNSFSLCSGNLNLQNFSKLWLLHLELSWA